MNVTAKFIAEYERLWRLVKGIKGAGSCRVQNTPEGIIIYVPPADGGDGDGRPSGGGGFFARITNVSGSFPLFTYTGQRVIGYDSTLTGSARAVTDGEDKTLVNGFELVTGTAPYTHAVGVTISNATTGVVNSGSCVIKAIGIGAVVWVEPFTSSSGDITYLFSAPNSAQ